MNVDMKCSSTLCSDSGLTFSLGVRVVAVLLCLSPACLLAQQSVSETTNGDTGSNGLTATPDITDTATTENAATTETDSAPDRSRILYIDPPQQLVEGIDPTFAAIPGADFTENVSAQQRVQVMRNYEGTIASIENNGGAWDRALTEELVALGVLQQQEGAHPEAIETLSRAMHVNRINEGLHTLGQVAMVERMIDSYVALGDWSNVDLYQNYLFYVQQKAYGSDDPRLIPVLHRLGEWNIEAFNLGFGDPLGGRLSTAQLLFNAATRMVGIHFGRNDERYVPYLRSIATSAYLVARHPDYMTELNRPDYASAQEMLRYQLNETRSPEPRGYSAGLNALQEVTDIYREQGDQPYLLAEALANQADWQLIFDRFRAAEELYAEAWQVLNESENGEELIHELFGQVRPIPTFAELPTNLLLGSPDSQERGALHYDYADVRFDVNQNGAPRNVEVLTEETEDNARQLSRLRREVLRSLFRPLIVDGKIESSESHVFRYRYWY